MALRVYFDDTRSAYGKIFFDITGKLFVYTGTIYFGPEVLDRPGLESA